MLAEKDEQDQDKNEKEAIHDQIQRVVFPLVKKVFQFLHYKYPFA